MSRFNAALSVAHGVSPDGCQSFRSITSAMISRVVKAAFDSRNTMAVASKMDKDAGGLQIGSVTFSEDFLVFGFTDGGLARERRFGVAV